MSTPPPDPQRQPPASPEPQPTPQPGYGQQPAYGHPPAYGQQLPAGQVAYGQVPGPPQFYQPPPKPGPMPTEPVEYQHMLRGPRYRWWRPLLSLLLFGAFFFVASQLILPILMVAGVIAGVDDPIQWAIDAVTDLENVGLSGFFAVNASLIILIPCAGFAIWIAHRIRPKFMTSVRGGFRWKWFARCLVITVPIWLVYMGISVAVDPQGGGARPEQWGWLLVMVLIMTPFQAAGEEYAFRGWLLQNVGAWFKHRIVALVVPSVISIVAFGAAHTSPNIWILADLAVFTTVAMIATWRTGGLEAAIAIHAVNNVSVFIVVIMLGGWEDAFISTDTTSTPAALGVSILVNGAALALILWQAKKAKIQRTYEPRSSPEAMNQAAVQPS